MNFSTYKIKCPCCKKLLVFNKYNLFDCPKCNLEYAYTVDGLELYVGKFDYKLDEKYVPVKGIGKKNLEKYRKLALEMAGGETKQWNTFTDN